MRARAWLCVLGVALAVAALGAVVGCGNEGAKFPVTAGEMPEGGSWPGVYYNPVYGYLHLVAQEGNIVGRWRRTDSSHWGELSGTVEGNVLHFSWTEHKYGAIGPSADVKGMGVFVYTPGQNKIAELDGKYALEDSKEIGDWHCVKQVGLKPDLASITGDNPVEPAHQEQWK